MKEVFKWGAPIAILTIMCTKLLASPKFKYLYVHHNNRLMNNNIGEDCLDILKRFLEKSSLKSLM